MKQFNYIAKDKNNKVKKGTVEAKNEAEVVESLKEKSLTPVSVKPKGGNLFGKLNEIGHVSSTEKVIFSKELATLVSAGIPISQSMDVLEKQVESKMMKRAVAEVAKDVEGGLSLSEAMAKHPHIFSSLYISMVHAGEVGGMLDDTLEKVATEIEKDHELFAKIRGAMMYPAVIMTALVFVVIYLITNIIPQIVNIFTELGGELPASTKFLLGLSSVLSNYGVFVGIGLVLFIYIIRRVVKTNYKIRYNWHNSILHFPIIGKVVRKINITRFTRTLGSLLSSGITVLEALDIAGSTLKNEVFKAEIKEVAEKVEGGSPLAEPLKKSKVFPIMVAQMISVGEETGTMDKILAKLTRFYEREVDNTVKNLSSLIEPLLMIVIGVGVGFVVISVITPIYSITNLF
ncbi:MAG: type II secretion system F family protein [Patescibacteria group bacterium]|nr:type II secretion system F family protein [Patescibacteria group bacterium]